MKPALLLNILFRWVVKLAGGILALFCIYLLSALLLSHIPVPAEASVKQDVHIFLISNGVHTDLVLPARLPGFNWDSLLFTVHNHPLPPGSYLAFGWGNQAFYLNTPTWSDLKFSTAFKAAFGLGPSAMHVSLDPDTLPGRDCFRIFMNRDQYERLANYVRLSFESNQSHAFIPVPTGDLYGPEDFFYESGRKYDLFQTCNSWANEGLKAGGLPACTWTPFDRGLMRLYRRHSYNLQRQSAKVSE